MIPARHVVMRSGVVLIAALSVVAAMFGWPIWISVACVVASGAAAVLSGFMVAKSARELRRLERR